MPPGNDIPTDKYPHTCTQMQFCHRLFRWNWAANTSYHLSMFSWLSRFKATTSKHLTYVISLKQSNQQQHKSDIRMFHLSSISTAKLPVRRRIAKSFKLAMGMRQPWAWSVIDFIFLALAYEGAWPVLSLTVSSSHWQCTVSVLIIAELARGCKLQELYKSTDNQITYKAK